MREEARGGLTDTVCEFLWRVYGYPGPFAEQRPVTIDKYRGDAESLTEHIEAAGFVLVEVERWERVLQGARASVEPYYQEAHTDVDKAAWSLGFQPGDLEPGP